ncbi:hypothetical protein [Intrasporangium sp.]|uniref:hypothetical protein n=1 Tax=Intrasporangium sp. TaxID=1925024 RepID=UPI00293B6105|nr:hypothetical protein [Intrasporangium sp.]MDV3220160.1 hypothetical protein [Intrasporangium sp.]
MPLGSLPRASALRAAAVAVITATVWALAACSDEDLVDTIPPPRPNRTTTTTDGQTTTPAITPATTSPTSSATSSATTASTPAGPTTSASQL